MRIIFFLALLLVSSLNSFADVWVYDYPNNIIQGNGSNHSRSTFVKVEVIQNDETKEAYVMYDKNQEPGGNLGLNLDHHWTNFSMTGTVTVRITRLDNNNMTACKIYPSKKNINTEISEKTATFTIDESQLPLQVYAEMNNMGKNAVLIFADPKETDVPQKDGLDVEVIATTDDINTVRSKLQNSKTYKYFEEGIHQWGSETGTGYAGYKLPLISGKKIYIPGGAYIVGTFSGSPSNNKIYGRGIISCAGKNMIGGTSGIPFSIVQSDGSGKGQRYEGFVSLSPPHFHLTIRGEVDIDNVKMMGWWHSTDGITTGPNSSVKNCFFKVMDDAIKLYSDNCYHENNTMFHQVNGAPFQFSWGNQNSRNNVMINTYIVNSVYKSLSGTSNTAVINARSGKTGNVTENQVWDGIYIDNGCHRLLGLEPNGGTHRNYTIKNVEIRNGDKSKPQQIWSYMQDGIFSNIRIENFTINGKNITTTNTVSDNWNAGSWWFQGNTSALVFESCNDNEAPTSPGQPQVTNTGQSSITISWDASEDNETLAGYDIIVNGTKKQTSTSNSATITGLNCETEYTIEVVAFDACNNYSQKSASAVAITEICEIVEGCTESPTMTDLGNGKQNGQNRYELAPEFINPTGTRIYGVYYDEGGEGVAYSDKDEFSVWTGTQIRSDERVDNLDKNGDGIPETGKTEAGEWLEYTLNFSESGKYFFSVNAASNGTGKFFLKLNNEISGCLLTLSNTGNLSTYTDNSYTDSIQIEKGENVLTIAFESDGVNINYFEFTKVGELGQANNLFNATKNANSILSLLTPVISIGKPLLVKPNHPNESVYISIVDLSGKKIMNTNFENTNEIKEIPLPLGIMPGVYIIRANNKFSNASFKFLVQ